MECEIRKATLEDVDKIVELQQKLVYDQLSRDPYLSSDFTMPVVERKNVESNFDNENWTIFVGTADSEIVGFIEVYIQNRDYYFFMDDYAYIVNMYVDESKRIFKLSNTLRAKAEEWAKKKGVKYIQFDVFEHNSSLLKRFQLLGYNPYRHRVIKRI